MLAGGQPQEAMRALQRVVRRYGSGAEASTARAWNTTLYRLYVRPPLQPPYAASGRSIAGPGGRLRDVEAIALAPDGKLGVATRSGILVIDEGARSRASRRPPTHARSASTSGVACFVVQKTLVGREGDKGMQRLTLTASSSGGPKLLQDISAGARLSTGDMLVADREARIVSRFDTTGKSLGRFAAGRITRIAVGRNDEVALLDSESKGVVWTDRTGTVLAGFPLAAPATSWKRRRISPSTCSSTCMRSTRRRSSCSRRAASSSPPSPRTRRARSNRHGAGARQRCPAVCL